MVRSYNVLLYGCFFEKFEVISGNCLRRIKNRKRTDDSFTVLSDFSDKILLQITMVSLFDLKCLDRINPGGFERLNADRDKRDYENEQPGKYEIG